MQPVRRRITEILKERGHATVADLARMLGMAQVSVRHHLDILIGEGLVELTGVRRRDGAGRPSQIFALTAAAAKLFPQRHDVLAREMLQELKTSLPAHEVHSMLLRMAERTAHEMPPGAADEPIEHRLEEVTHFLTQKGYNARWEACNGHYKVHTCNCPYAGVSEQHPELCLMDHALMQYLVPGAVRLDGRVMEGATHCTYMIELAPMRSEAD